MPTQEKSFDWPLFLIFLRRYQWLLASCTVCSLLAAILVSQTLLNLYTASATLFISPEKDLQEIIGEKTAVTPELQTQIVKLKHILSSPKFIELNIIQELHLRLQDVYIPPLRFTIVPTVRTHLNEAKNLIKRLAGRLGSAQTAEEQRRQLMTIIRQQLTLEQSKGMLLTIAYTGPDPAIAQKIVAAAVEQGRNYLQQQTSRATYDALGYINTEYREIEDELAELEHLLVEKQVEQFDKGSEAKIALIQQRQEAQDRLRQLQRDLDALSRQRQDLQSATDKRRALLLSAPEFVKKLETTQHPLIVALHQKEQELTRLQVVYTDEYPEVKRLQQEIVEHQQAITRLNADSDLREHMLLTDQLYNQYRDETAQLEAQLKTLNTEKTALLENIALYEERLKSMPEFQKTLIPIQREIDLKTRQLVELATQRDKIQRTRDLQNGLAQIDTLSSIDPFKTSLANEKVGGVVFLLGPLLGVALIALLTYCNTTVKRADDVQRELHLPVLAVIPQTRFYQERRNHLRRIQQADRRTTPGRPKHLSPPLPRLELPKSDAIAAQPATEVSAIQEIPCGDLLLKHTMIASRPSDDQWMTLPAISMPETQTAEEYQRLSFQVAAHFKKAPAGASLLILVTSALPGEGKTLTACNLAATLAREHRVLLLDLNFRHPSVHQLFGVPAEPGITTLNEQTITPQMFQLTTLPNLSILPAGKMTGALAGFLHSTRLTQFLDTLKHAAYFEYIIVDMPAVAPFPDVGMLAPNVDSILWVIRELHTKKASLHTALSQLAHLPILGVVLNRSVQQPTYAPVVTPVIEICDRKLAGTDAARPVGAPQYRLSDCPH